MYGYTILRSFRKPVAKPRLEVYAVVRGILVQADSFAVLFGSFSSKEKRTYNIEENENLGTRT